MYNSYFIYFYLCVIYNYIFPQKLKSNGYIRKKLPAALVGRPRRRLGRQRENLAGTLVCRMLDMYHPTPTALFVYICVFHN